MKSTKRILSAILALCMVFGCFAVGFTAQATGADLQAAIDANYGGELNWKGGDVTVEEALVINGDIEINFNNAVITGAEGISVVNVKGGNVKLYNGIFIANNKSYSGETGFIKSLMNYRPAVSINGGDVTLDCITAVGSLLRVPNSGTIEVTTGNGINANAGNVTIRDSIAIGMKALDNTKASVLIEDALFVGIYKAINDVKKVTYADGYEQYKTVDFAKALLADGVTLTDGEEAYLDSFTNSQGDISVGSVIASVKAPEFAALESAYENGVLTLTAATGAAAEDKAEVPNRYSYDYIPVSVTVDGEKADFAQVDGVYTAQVAAEANTTYTAETEYKLSLKLGAKQKEVVENSLDYVAKYADKLPELAYRFVKDFEDLWQKAEEYAALVYGVLTDPMTDDVDFVNTAEMKEVKALMYAVLGQNKIWNGNELCFEDNTSITSRHKRALAALNAATTDEALASAIEYADTVAASMQADEITYDIYAGFEGFFGGSLYAYKNDLVATGADGKYTQADVVKYMNGKGLLEEFEDYYWTLKDMIYGDSTTEFADPAAAAEFVGDNWEDILALVENVVVVFNKVDEIVNNEEGDVRKLLEKAGIGSVDTLIKAFNTGAKYVDKIVARLDEAKNSSFVAKYGDKAGYFCKQYTNKALKILDNPHTYFDVEVNGDFVNLISFTETQEITTPSDGNVRVEVTVAGAGAASLNGTAFTTYYVGYYNIGDAIEILPEGENFHYIAVESDGASTVVNGNSYVAKAATNIEITVVFEQEVNVDTGVAEVIFMTDKALGYKFLDKLEREADAINNRIFNNVSVPEFKGLTFTGWSMTADEIKAAVEGGSSVVLVYAQYDYEATVVVPTQDEAIKMTDVTVEGSVAYFEATIQVPEGYKAIEAGIFATKNADYATEANMTIALSGTSGVKFGRIDENKDADGYVNTNVVYTYGIKASGTVYARGYIVLVDEAGNTETVYTDIVNATI